MNGRAAVRRCKLAGRRQCRSGVSSIRSGDVLSGRRPSPSLSGPAGRARFITRALGARPPSHRSLDRTRRVTDHSAARDAVRPLGAPRWAGSGQTETTRARRARRSELLERRPFCPLRAAQTHAMARSALQTVAAARPAATTGAISPALFAGLAKHEWRTSSAVPNTSCVGVKQRPQWGSLSQSSRLAASRLVRG